MKIWRAFVHYFVPHKRNRYRPHFLRAEMASITAAAIGILFVGASFVDHLIIAVPTQFAAVIGSTLVELANAGRARAGLVPLVANQRLQEAAQLKANDMATKGYFAHDSPDGHDPWHWFSQAGYRFSYAGENLAVYFTDSADVNAAWMKSPEHRANILNDHFTEIGIATAVGTYNGYQTIFVVQEFGSPLRATEVQPAKKSGLPASTKRTAVSGSASNVAGAHTEPSVQVLEKSDTYIAVKSENAAAPESEGTAVQLPPSRPWAVSVGWLATSPHTVLMYLYACIAAVVLLALVLDIGVEVRRHNPLHVARGVGLLLLMGLLLYGGQSYLFGKLMIV